MAPLLYEKDVAPPPRDVVCPELTHVVALFIEYSISIIADPPSEPSVKFKIKLPFVGVKEFIKVGAFGAVGPGFGLGPGQGI